MCWLWGPCIKKSFTHALVSWSSLEWHWAAHSSPSPQAKHSSGKMLSNSHWLCSLKEQFISALFCFFLKDSSSMVLTLWDAQPWIAKCIYSHNRKSMAGYFHFEFCEILLMRYVNKNTLHEKISLPQKWAVLHGYGIWGAEKSIATKYILLFYIFYQYSPGWVLLSATLRLKCLVLSLFYLHL